MTKLFKVFCLAFCVSATSFSSIHAKPPSVSNPGTQNEQKTVAAAIAASNNDARPLYPVPEPSTGSLILLGLGGFGLALKLRKKA